MIRRGLNTFTRELIVALTTEACVCVCVCVCVHFAMKSIVHCFG